MQATIRKRRLGLSENIIGFSKTNSIEELAGIYSSADVYLNLTLEEVLGMTNIEALACGTPDITFNSGGSPESIDKKSGEIVTGYETSSVLRAIRAMAINKADTKNCLNRAELFSKEEKTRSDLEIYDNFSKKLENNYIRVEPHDIHFCIYNGIFITNRSFILCEHNLLCNAF